MRPRSGRVFGTAWKNLPPVARSSGVGFCIAEATGSSGAVSALGIKQPAQMMTYSDILPGLRQNPHYSSPQMT